MDKMLPNIYDVTSVFRPLVIDVIKIPAASELEETKAIAASPFKDESFERRSKKNEAIIEIGMETPRGEKFNAIAIAKVPNPTWLSPSPIMENLFNTKLIPRRDAHRATKLPAIAARKIKPYENNSVKNLIIFMHSFLNCSVHNLLFFVRSFLY